MLSRGNKNSLDSPTVHVCQDMTPGIMSQEEKFAPTTVVSQDNVLGEKFTPSEKTLQRANCISPFHYFTIDGNVSQKQSFTIGQFHHITITPYNDFTISPYVQKIFIHHDTIWKTKKPLHYFTPKPNWHIPIIIPY